MYIFFPFVASLFLNTHQIPNDQLKWLETAHNEQLLERYAWAAQVSRNTDLIVEFLSPMGVAAGIGSPRSWVHLYYLKARDEIIRRKTAIVPDLLKFIELERSIASRHHGYPRKYLLPELIYLLQESRDLRVVPTLAAILDSPSSVPRGRDRVACRKALARLTLVCFHDPLADRGPFDLHEQEVLHCIPHPAAYLSDDAAIAKQVRTWLDTEGKDQANWPILAWKYARAHLHGNDIQKLRHAAVFLSHTPTQRDDNPNDTLQVLAAQFDLNRNGDIRIRPATNNWLGMMTCYGTLAQPYSDRFIKSWYYTEGQRSAWALVAVGGDVILNFAMNELTIPTFSRPVRQSYSDSLEGLFDRWVGMPFEITNDRVVWWAKHKKMPVETRFREHMPVLAKKVDAGDQRAAWLLSQIIPECYQAVKSHGRNCASWLESHQSRLQYDAQSGSFRLATERMIEKRNP